MTRIAQKHPFRKEASRDASAQDLRKVFTEELNGLYQLSFLLTRDHEKAQQCLVAGFEDFAKGNRGFSEWARSWEKRVIIENAIRELKPRPHGSYSSSPATVFPDIAELSSSSRGHFELEAILALEDFERFVFVMAVLEQYSEGNCALLLGCSVSEIRAARTRAIDQLINSLQMVLPNNQVFPQEK
jgi:DNA-directed RNA polymerase specialized sigma24 family protein